MKISDTKNFSFKGSTKYFKLNIMGNASSNNEGEGKVVNEMDTYLENITVLYDEDEIADAVHNVAEEITEDYRGKEVVLVCVLKGAVFFMADLSRVLGVPHEHRYITASSYLDDQSTGKVTITEMGTLNVEGKHVIIVEDIVDTGLTLKTLVEHIQEKEKPASIACCALLDKPSKRVHEVDVKYTGIEIEDQFVLGYGLDYNEKYRDLPFIGVYSPPPEEPDQEPDQESSK
jgi:hypoxanthine phosphoribosyltransferase